MDRASSDSIAASGGAFQRLDALLPSRLPIRAGVLSVGLGLWLLGVALVASAIGLGADQAFGSLIPIVLEIGGLGWFVIYPALMHWREWSAGRGTDYLNEADYVARVPRMEPVIALMTLAGLVAWLAAGGHTREGVAAVIGYVVGILFGLAGVGFASVLFVRPLARARMKARALHQYMQAGVFNLRKNNAKRARRFFELALELALGTPRANAAAEGVRTATVREAEELRLKGYTKNAEELIQAVRARPGMELVVGWDGAPSGAAATLNALEASDAAPARSVSQGTTPPVDDLPEATPPMVLDPKDVLIGPAPPEEQQGPDEAALRLRASLLVRRNRVREAIELLVRSNLKVPKDVAEAGAQAYVAAGCLRSAAALYECLGQRQIPEFYKSAAAEWGREGRKVDPAPLLKFVQTLIELGEEEAAARLAFQAAVSERGESGHRQVASSIALELCGRLGLEPPSDLLEIKGDLAAAATAYEQEGRATDALRCWRAMADKLIRNDAPDGKLIPVLARLFAADPDLPDKYLEPLVNHSINVESTSSSAVKILDTYRSRHPRDARVVGYLTRIHARAQRLDDALLEVDRLLSQRDVAPEASLRILLMLDELFPHNFKVGSRLVEGYMRLEQIPEAVERLRMLIAADQRTPSDATVLVDFVRRLVDRGHGDIELRRDEAELCLEAGDREGAISAFEQYVHQGGRNPSAMDVFERLLNEDLVDDQDELNLTAHVRLARLHIIRGSPRNAIRVLDALRTPVGHDDADGGEEGRPENRPASQYELPDDVNILLARAELQESNPRRSIHILRTAIGTRKLSVAPELHFELARAYEAVGEVRKAQKIDHAMSRILPDFREAYLNSRVQLAGADTEWTLHQSAADDTAPEQASGPSAKIAPEVFGELGMRRPREIDLSAALLPRYRTIRRLGVGGMGEVHLAEDLDLGRQVAIKVLRRTLATDLFIAKFRDEARIVAQLSHPGIVAIYDLGQRASWAFIVMEYVAGQDLASLTQGPSPLTCQRILEVIARVAEAMAYAHGRGVVHRDLKPANILVSDGGGVKVTDFGIARVLQPDRQDQRTAFSAAGLQVGTVNYMAPEQLREGEDTGPATDIYLLGTTLYYCLAKAFPFQGDAVGFLKLSGEPTPLSKHLPEISDELEACVLKCLAREPGDRFISMLDLALCLRGLPEANMTEVAV
ncbi:MAG: serine/threonine protein kinase [Deltaproteobacteria bacterium]|nr:serine/threonine protein kinase [Deltaproteobacteria bacterium]